MISCSAGNHAGSRMRFSWPEYLVFQIADKKLDGRFSKTHFFFQRVEVQDIILVGKTSFWIHGQLIIKIIQKRPTTMAVKHLLSSLLIINLIALQRVILDVVGK